MSNPQILGKRYKIIEKLADGLVGPVFRGMDLETGQPVAIKALNPDLVAAQPILLERFKREDELLRELNHPNIVRRMGAVEQDLKHYLVMEYIEGGSLRGLLEREARLPVERVLEIAIDLADALARAHRLGIIHRDLKPENVLIAPDGTPRLSDFGMAHSVKRSTFSQPGGFVGTWVYIPPESFRGVEADERADIWSFGVMLFEMLAGCPPFAATTPAEVVNAVLLEPLPDLRAMRPDLPAELYELIERMLTKEREARLGSARVVGAALEAIARGQVMELPTRQTTPRPYAAPHNLPEQFTPFIGREGALESIVHLLRDQGYRLVTVTGPGGVGKTRLAIQAASQVLGNYTDGVYFVNLAPIMEPGLVPNRIAQVLGIKGTHSRSLVEDLKDTLRSKHMLLILDNFEQVIDAAPLVSEMISAVAGLHVLVTSRESLRVYGEREYPLPPLALPDLELSVSPQTLSQNESVALFVQRAQAASPHFELSGENASTVAKICIQLDGLPLAIELAAARVKLYPVKYLLGLLSDALDTLTSGPRDIAARHQTLRAAIEWSYMLLDEGEKKLFARLSVFQGGRTLEAVRAVCSEGLDIDVLVGLESLYNKSLLQQKEGVAGEPRFALLETIYQYARERLGESGEAEEIRRRHAIYMVGLAESAEPGLKGPRQEYWSNLLRTEYDNLRAALAWSLQGTDPSIGIRLAGALSEFWYYEGPISEGELWIESALERVSEAAPEYRARVLNGAGLLAFARGEHARGKRWNREALTIWQELGDKAGSAYAYFLLSAHATMDPNEYAEGIGYCEQALALYQELDDKPGLAWVYNQLGELYRLTQAYERSRQAYENSLAICRQTGNRRREAIALVNLSYAAQHQGDYHQAETFARQGLALLHDLQLKYHSTIVLSMLAGPVAAQGNARRAAILLGASEAIFESMSVSLQPADKVEIDRYVASARAQLDEAEFQAAWAQGRQMSFEQAVAFALEGRRAHPTPNS